MKELIEDNYRSTELRGLISSKTTVLDFLQKIDEERQELDEAIYCGDSGWPEELADIILVCLNFAHHFSIPIEQELKNKIEKNFRRAEKKTTN